MTRSHQLRLAEQFRSEAEQDMNLVLTAGLDPMEEYLSAIAELTGATLLACPQGRIVPEGIELADRPNPLA